MKIPDWLREAPEDEHVFVSEAAKAAGVAVGRLYSIYPNAIGSAPYFAANAMDSFGGDASVLAAELRLWLKYREPLEEDVEKEGVPLKSAGRK